MTRMPLSQAIQTYPLTSSQREIWFDQMLNADIPLYNIGGYVKIPGRLDTVLFEQAVNLLVQKHDALRTVLLETTDEDGVPLQAFVEHLQVSVPVQDVSAEADPHAAALAWMQARFEQPFALTGQPLFRYDLVKLAEDSYYWLLQYHHLILDGWGVALVNRSLAAIYTALTEGEVPDLSSPSYIPFIDDDRQYVESSLFQTQRDYWLEKYSTPPEPLLTPRYHAQYAGERVGSGCETLFLPRDLYQRLAGLAQRHNATLFHVLLGALYVYFTRTAQREDFAIGLPVLNRANARFRQTAGLFVGVSPAVFQVSRDASFGELLQHISKTLKANYRHQRFPVSELNRVVGLEQGRSQLFDVNLSYEQHDNSMMFGEVLGQLIPLLHGYEQTPLLLFVRDFHAHYAVHCDFVYNRAYFNAEEVHALQARFVTLLEAVLEQDQRLLHQLPTMTSAERQQLQAWNDTAVDYPQDQTIVSLFEEQVVRTPDNTAVVFESQSLTYAALNARANQLAHVLIQHGVMADTLVGICVERSLEMVIGLLAILKAGGAYVPLDPSYPAERLAFMLQDSQVTLLLTQTHLQGSLPLADLNPPPLLVCVDDPHLTAGQPEDNPPPRSQPQSLAYVLFTSGSTGKPKGVMIEHYSAYCLIRWAEKVFPKKSLQGTLASTSINFDLSVYELFVPLSSGNTVLLAQNALHLPTLKHRHAVTLINTVPSAIAELLRSGSIPASVQTINLAGEALQRQLVQALYELPHIQEVYNLYGPSEDTTYSTFTLVSRESSTSPRLR
jgi:non-ribosomal peptide synthetase component F